MTTEKRSPAQCFPPGEFIRDELEARGWSVADLAERTRGGVFPKRAPAAADWQAIINGAPLSEWDAHLLHRAFGTSTEYWLNLDRSYRTWLKEKR